MVWMSRPAAPGLWLGTFLTPKNLPGVDNYANYVVKCKQTVVLSYSLGLCLLSAKHNTAQVVCIPKTVRTEIIQKQVSHRSSLQT